MLTLRLVHFLGLAAWIGGWFAVSILYASAHEATAAIRNALYHVAGRIFGLIIAPGVVATLMSGLLLTTSLATRTSNAVMMRPGLLSMQVAGLVAGLLALFVGFPAANQLALLARRSELNDLSPAGARLRKRIMVVLVTSGFLALFALVTGVIVQ